MYTFRDSEMFAVNYVGNALLKTVYIMNLITYCVFKPQQLFAIYEKLLTSH